MNGSWSRKRKRRRKKKAKQRKVGEITRMSEKLRK